MRNVDDFDTIKMDPKKLDNEAILEFELSNRTGVVEFIQCILDMLKLSNSIKITVKPVVVLRSQGSTVGDRGYPR